MSHRQKMLDKGLLYSVADVPPPCLGLILGFQHFMVMLGATSLIPLLTVPAMGGSMTDTAEVISSIFFVSGLNTLVQSTFGDRLPIIQGGSFAFLNATFAIIFSPTMLAIEDNNERFRTTMCVIQGCMITLGLIQVTLGYTGALAVILRFVTPITIAPTTSMIALGLFGAMNGNMVGCEWMWGIGCILLVTFGYMMPGVKVPLPGGSKVPIFALFPVLWMIATTWLIGGLADAAGAFEPIDDGNGTTIWAGAPQCKTKGDVLANALWAKLPYPGQWGAPIFYGWAIGPMVGAMLVSMVESVGDYYACASLSGAPPPSGSVISRGLAGEGWGLIICGLFGTSNGTTSYGENIGAISLTRVGSRAVAQAGACCMIFFGLFPKFGALFVALPNPIIAAMYSCMFGMIASAGISLLDNCDLKSSRNLFILGFCFYNGLALAGPSGVGPNGPTTYFSHSLNSGNMFGAEDTFWLTFMNNPMIISLLAGLLLDNIIPGTDEERGKWKIGETIADEEFQSVYGLPWCLAKVFKNCVYLDFLEGGFKWPPVPEGGHKSSSGDCCEMLCPFGPFKPKPKEAPAITKESEVAAA